MSYEVKLKNDIVQAKEKGEDLGKFINKGKPSLRTINSWYRSYLQNGLFTETNNNDAIPSWSGYNYQGKTMILVTLQLINKLFYLNNEDIVKWSVELEKLQDFVLKENGVVNSLWQVKATLSKKKSSLYYEALEKLIKDKNLSNNKNAECYLISANDIGDWNDNENQFRSLVKLYKYNDEIVSLKHVAPFIKKEVKKLMNNLDIKDNEEDIYLIICEFIEQKIFQYHINGKKSSYEIQLVEIINHIKNVRLQRESLEKLRMKEKLFEHITEAIQRDTKEFCEECEHEDKCDFECGALKNYELTSDIKIEEYLRYLQPEVERNSIFEYSIKRYMYADNICSVFKESNIKAIDCIDSMIYLVLV